jgi:hypothetical protein
LAVETGGYLYIGRRYGLFCIEICSLTLSESLIVAKSDQHKDTGDNVPKEGALAILHKKELVLNEQQTSDLLKTIKILDNIKHLFKNKFLTPDININAKPSLTNDKQQIVINMPVKIEKLVGTAEGANEFLKTINQNLKRMGVFTKI